LGKLYGERTILDFWMSVIVLECFV
jgi:hypothetical protein